MNMNASLLQSPQAATSYYRPIATWSGRLILPEAGDRRPDGGVYLQLENTPPSHRSLIGQRVWLAWHPNSIHAAWLSKAVCDVTFDEITYASQQKGVVHPDRLNGWEKVSPLESLAGARLQDDVQVELDVAAVKRSLPGTSTDWTVLINDEPVQITGILRALVQFLSPLDRQYLCIRHYNPDSRTFDGPTAIACAPDAGTIHPAFQLEQSSIQGIERSPLNDRGWYVYGYFPSLPSQPQRHRPFVIQAIEPYAALCLAPTKTVMGQNEARQYIRDQKWDEMPLHQMRVTLVDTNGRVEPAAERTPSRLAQRTKELWWKGDEALVVHTFGWRGGPRGDRFPLGLVPGHFAFGFAKLTQDDWTGELRFDLIYRQVYTHNAQGTISGAFRWHSYMGCLKRGWMYTVPVSDVMVRLPELTVPYQIGDRKIQPLDMIKRELAYMHARYRVGGGNGASLITPATSCVKDSNQALFSAIRQFRDQVIADPATKAWLEQNPNDYHTQRFRKLVTLLKQIEEEILFPLGYVPPTWRGENDEVAAHQRDRADWNLNIEALKAWRTMLPRRAERELLAVLRKHGATMVDYQCALIGGEVPGIRPAAPTVLL